MVFAKVALAALAASLAGGNPCATSGDFTPDVTYQEEVEDFGVGDTTCSASTSWITDSNFVASKENCEEAVPTSNFIYAQWLAHLGSKCCGGSAAGDICMQYGPNYCKVKDDYTAAEVASEEDGTTCSQAMSFVPTFTPSKTSCAEEISIGDDTQSRSIWLAWIASSCCGSTGHVCTEFQTVVNPCETADDYKPDGDLGDFTCAVGVGMMFSAEPTKVTCDEETEDDGVMKKKRAILTEVAPLCCGGKATKCDAFPADDSDGESDPNLCKVKDDYTPEEVASEDEGTVCWQAMSWLPTFTPSKTTCAENVSVPTLATQSRSVWLAWIASSCCGSTGHVCTEFETVVNPDSDSDSDDDDSSNESDMAIGSGPAAVLLAGAAAVAMC